MEQRRRRLPSTASLQVLLAVAERGSTSAAAETTALSQSAVSKQLLALEELIGSPAFLRTPHGMVATEAGRIYIDHARTALKAMEDAALLVARLKPGPGVLRLQVLPIFGDRWLLPKFHLFAEQHPDIEVQFTTFISPSQSEVPDGIFEFAATPQHRDNSTYLFGQDVLLVSAPNYFAKAGTPCDIDDLAEHVMLEHPQTPFHWQHFVAHHNRDGATVRHITRFGYYTMVIRAALAGQGLALIPRGLILDEIATGRLINPAGLGYRSDFGYWFSTPHIHSSPSMLTFKTWLTAQLGPELDRP
jgi:DNA-binding transcriptional LysR family regulator